MWIRDSFPTDRGAGKRAERGCSKRDRFVNPAEPIHRRERISRSAGLNADFLTGRDPIGRAIGADHGENVTAGGLGGRQAEVNAAVLSDGCLLYTSRCV